MRKIALFIAALAFAFAPNAFAQTRSATSWTSATAQDATLPITSAASLYQVLTVSFTPIGTITGGTITFEASPDGGNTWFPIALATQDTLQPQTSYALNGAAKEMWSGNFSAYTNFRVHLSSAITGTGTAAITLNASQNGYGGPQVSLPTTDPCMAPNVVKSSKIVNATGQIVAASGTTSVYICGMYATLGGTSPTLTLQYGTGTNCGTGTTSLTGAFALTVGQEFFIGHGGTVVQTPASQAFCIALGGTSPTIAGVLTYVQQ